MQNIEEQSQEYGFVYVLKNECMPDIIKIGITDNLEERMRVLYNTSVPLPFEAAYVCKVRKQDMRRIEDALHRAFALERVNPRREFFRTSEDRVIPMLSLFQLENVTDEANAEIDATLDPSEIIARDTEREEAPKRKQTFNFYALGIKQNDTLIYKDDPQIFVTVASERKVVYNGELMSLTAATSKIKGLSYGIQPTPFWLFNGRVLIDIYNERYAPLDSEV